MGVMDDLRYAARSLWRRPTVTVFAALTLALGIGATTAMFSTVEAVVLNPLPYDNGDRLATLFRRVDGGRVFLSPRSEDIERFRRHTDLVESFELVSGTTMTLTGIGEPRQIATALVRTSLLEMLDRAPILGRAFVDSELAGEGERVVMLGHGFWQRELGGSRDVLGSTLLLDGESWTIVGVLPPRTVMPGWRLAPVEVWRPLPYARPDGGGALLAVLRDGVTIDALNERLESAGDLGGEGPPSTGYAQLIRDTVGQGVRGHLGLLMGAVVLLLLIACVNVANLLIFRADTRKRETAVRSALGAGRGRLARQLLIESLVLALVGGTLGVALSYAGQAAILELRPDQLDVLDGVTVNWRVLLFALGVALGTGVLFGLVPALQVGRSGTATPLRSGVRTEGDIVGRRLRWVLVAGEVALSFALLLGSLGVLDTLVERMNRDVGFDADRVLMMQASAPSWRYEAEAERTRLFEDVLARLRTLPGVAMAARSSGAPPNSGITFGPLEVEGGAPTESSVVLHGPPVDAAYFETLGQSLVRGRGFTEEDLRGEEHVVVIGETMASTYFADRDPVGARFRLGDGEWYRVLGVAADVPMTGLSATTLPLQIYHPQRGSWDYTTFLVRLADATPAEAVMPLMREAALATEPELRIDELALAETLLRGTLDRERFATTLMATFAALALVLASIGLYGVVSQVVGQRTREFGIRIALGAGRPSIAGMVLRRAGGATLVGIVAGVVLGAAGTRILDSRVYGLSAATVGTYLLAAGALGLTALLAAYAPARRATAVDPVEAMRLE